MSRWQEVLVPDDFKDDLDVSMNAPSGDERDPRDYRQPLSSFPPPTPLSRVAPQTHGVRRHRGEMVDSPVEEMPERRPRYAPPNPQNPIPRRHEITRQARPGSATSSHASSSKTSQSSLQRVHMPPHPQSAQSLQSVTQARNTLPPISSFDYKPFTTPQNAIRENSRNVHASVPSTIAGCGLTASCPAMGLWAPDQVQQPATSSTGTAKPVPISLSIPPLIPLSEAQQSGAAKRFAIRTDLQFDKASHLMTATLELPGLDKSEIKVALRRCPFSRVQHLTISGTSRPADGSWALRERKYGEFGRTLLVPPGTKPEDIRAELKNGLLTIQISGCALETDDNPIQIPILG